MKRESNCGELAEIIKHFFLIIKPDAGEKDSTSSLVIGYGFEGPLRINPTYL